MIKVTRLDAPGWLTRYAQKWTDALLEAVEQHRQGDKAPADALWNKYNKPYVKTALRTMFHDKCAYCESKVTHVAYAHIEHYRPKKQYPAHTFDWQNLLLACGICNGAAHKGDHFPLDNGDEDKPLLLNPCVDDPDQHLRFEQARLVSLSNRGQETVRLLGLNSRDELFDRRRTLLMKIDYIRRSVAQFEAEGNTSLAQRGRELLERAMVAEAEYAAMTRQFMANPLPDNPPL